jgi:hypothetical protein
MMLVLAVNPERLAKLTSLQDHLHQRDANFFNIPNKAPPAIGQRSDLS